ncbi:MAG TPA: choice-of-anchor D domain-containing protein [Rhodanobacteraceae bacterium]|nr:choice-of-anchor D domain-containing protein [Rhodanobacteraceae bacterium]
MHPMNPAQATFRQKALVIGLLGALPLAGVGLPFAHAMGAVSSANATASTWVVENCDDAGSGSLRDAVEVQAISGDTVDLSQLTCSTITLTSGAIVVTEDDLLVAGPGATALSIDGGFATGAHRYNRVLEHSGSGTLAIQGLTLENAELEGDNGGCIDSGGSVSLTHVALQDCRISSGSGGAYPDIRGGAIYTAANLTLDHSSITGNRGYAGGDARGCGAFVQGDLAMLDSVISGNLCTSLYRRALGGGLLVQGTLTMTRSTVESNRVLTSTEDPYYSAGGGIWSGGAFIITQSTIADNRAQQAAGLFSIGSNPADARKIIDSTVSSNTSDEAPAGIYMVLPLTLANSTVAFNVAGTASADSDAGIRSVLGLSMQSSIVAGNTAAGTPGDVLGDVTGANNLIYEPGTSSIPADTLVGTDPLLGPLLDNGGTTANHLLLAGSPAIDAGNNAAGEGSDQRGFPRVAGAAADIGAVEVQPPAVLIDPADLDFMTVDVGDVSAVLTTTLANDGDTPLHVDSIQTATAPFAQTVGSCAPAPFDLAGRASCTLEFTFAPFDSGPFSTTLGITTNAGDAEITLHGEGLQGNLAVTPNVVDFGNIAVGASAPPQTVTIRNAGTSPLVVSAADAPNAPFVAIGGTCGAAPFELDVDASCSLEFEFAPQTAGAATQTLTVTSDVGNDDFTLLGSGVIGDRIFAAGFDP